ncbi:GNAT family N-acetyltransferase [Micromonospora sp. NPDC048830]|uniref:GNAT family N-acetyltransferase n=1 Tax=Micromonospora sp. NPDC048830 TaxID=3364257 RepID=UPI00371DCDED
MKTEGAVVERRTAVGADADPTGSGTTSSQAGLTIATLHTGEQIETAAELLWTVWGASTDAERSELINVSLLRTLCHSGNYVVGAYRDGRMVGCTVGMLGARTGRPDHLHSYITGVSQAERGRGTGLALKRHQRRWALERGIDAISWTYDPLVCRNGYFNLCKLGATVTAYRPDFYGRLDDGVNTNERTDRLLVEWALRSEWVEQAMTGEPGAMRRHARVVPGAELIAVPEDIEMLRRTDRQRAQRERFEVRDRFLALFADNYRVAGMTSTHEYVLVPAHTTPSYEP